MHNLSNLGLYFFYIQVRICLNIFHSSLLKYRIQQSQTVLIFIFFIIFESFLT